MRNQPVIFSEDFSLACPLQEMRLISLNEHTGENEVAEFIKVLRDEEDAGLLSEAGAPCVADPGNILVRAAHRNQVRVVPLVGPSALLLAVMASGLNGQKFQFLGYPPKQVIERKALLNRVEKKASRERVTSIFIETPYRTDSFFEELKAHLSPETVLSVAVELTGAEEKIDSHPIHEWRAISVSFGKLPAVFAIGI